ncbi:energy-coupling factor transporter transmembrane protein EcfT [bacterium]|nr:energy-coupling factor transporter transmembrane protein EcfT [bacterium]
MAELAVFNYSPGCSFLHHLDIRFKLIILAFINFICMNSGFLNLLCLNLMLILLVIHSKLPLLSALKDMKFFLLLLLFVFVSRALSTPGESLLTVGIFSVSKQGILGGLLICWQLAVIVMAGLVFIFTSRMFEIKAGIEWFLKPIPGIPEKRVGIMLSLMIRFLPMILEEAKETSDAQRSRGIENRKNPVARLVLFTVPFTRRVFETADRLAIAMEARCYSEDRTDPEITATRKDWLFFSFSVFFCAAAFNIDTLIYSILPHFS